MIGLIFGETNFPIEILKKIKKKRLKYLIIDLSKSKKFKKEKKSYSVSIGQFGKIINILKDHNCKKVLFAGKVLKPNFSALARASSVVPILEHSDLKEMNCLSFSNFFAIGWSTDKAIKEAPNKVSGLVVKTLILFFWFLLSIVKLISHP